MKAPPRRHIRFEHAGSKFTATVSAKNITFRRYRSRRTRTLSLVDALDAAGGQKLLPLH